MSSPHIAKLEALLARIKANAASPRIQQASPVMMTVPPTADARATLEDEQDTVEREVEAPLESRARLVAAPQSEEPEEIEADDVLELDDRHVVEDVAPKTPAMEFAKTIEAKGLEPEPEREEPPPSSRRPITEPAETPQEAQIQVAHTPPPESGKQVAADALSFDDDFTGVREAPPTRVPVTPEPSIQLQSLRMPAVSAPAALDEMEVQLPSAQAPGEATRPPPGPVPEAKLPEAEVSRPTRPVAASNVAEMVQSVAVPAPKTFGELLDLTLSL